MAFVLDASTAVSWFLEDEETSSTRHLLERAESGEEAHVPSHWWLEVLSAFLKAERRKRAAEFNLNDAMEFLYLLRLTVQPVLNAGELRPVLVLCRRHRLSAYDAVYLSLAHDLGLPLATRDEALIRACGVEGVELVEA